MSARKVEIVVAFHPLPPGAASWPRWDWSVTLDGVRASGDGPSQRAALRYARRRVRKIERLRAKLDVPSLIDASRDSEAEAPYVVDVDDSVTEKPPR